MRYAIAIVCWVACAAGCGDDAKVPGLEQVSDTRSAPTPDATRQDGEVNVDVTEPEIGPVECARDEDCVADVCFSGGCVGGVCRFEPLTGSACDDGNACTPTDLCRDGVCEGSGRLECLDADPCTDDRCLPSVGCEHGPKTCDDDNACTTDECRPGVGCVATAISCTTNDPCAVAVCEPAVGCTERPRDGGACDDGRACTTDSCVDGECVGVATGCDDDNACTVDSCSSNGCEHVSIPGCANDEACLGRVVGAACDDRDEATSADMCIGGDCRGYRLTRIPGSTLQGQQSLVVTDLDHGVAGWSAIVGSIDVLQKVSYSIVGLDNPGAPVIHSATTQITRIAVLRDGFAGDADGRVWRYDNGWSRSNAWDTALAEGGRDAIDGIFTVAGTVAGASARSTWFVGGGEGAWLRICKQLGQNTVCSAQILSGDAIPRAIAGVPSCEDGACAGATLALGADALVGGGFHYTEVYGNETGTDVTWSEAYRPDAPANRATRAMAGWRDDEGVRFVVVGDNGYVLVRRGDGSWRGPVVVRDGQAARDFSGVWVGSGLVVISAHRVGSQDNIIYELWTAPADSDLESSNSWVVHELGRFPEVPEAGLEDVVGNGGQLRVVGAVRRALGLFDWVDGAVWVRQ